MQDAAPVAAAAPADVEPGAAEGPAPVVSHDTLSQWMKESNSMECAANELDASIAALAARVSASAEELVAGCRALTDALEASCASFRTSIRIWSKSRGKRLDCLVSEAQDGAGFFVASARACSASLVDADSLFNFFDTDCIDQAQALAAVSIPRCVAVVPSWQAIPSPVLRSAGSVLDLASIKVSGPGKAFCRNGDEKKSRWEVPLNPPALLISVFDALGSPSLGVRANLCMQTNT